MKSENALIIGVVVLCVLVAGSLLIGSGIFYRKMMSGFYGGMSIFGWFFMILIIIILVLLIAWLMNQIGNTKGREK